MRILQNRRYHQAVEIRKVASSTLRSGNSEIKVSFWFVFLFLIFTFSPKSEQRKWLDVSRRLLEILPSGSLQQSIPTREQVSQSSWQVSWYMCFGQYPGDMASVNSHCSESTQSASHSTCQPCRNRFLDFTNRHHGRYLSLRHFRRQKPLNIAELFRLANCKTSKQSPVLNVLQAQRGTA